MRLTVAALFFALISANAIAQDTLESALSGHKPLTGWERYSSPGWYLIRFDAPDSDIWRGPYQDEAACDQRAESRNKMNAEGDVPTRYYCQHLAR